MHILFSYYDLCIKLLKLMTMGILFTGSSSGEKSISNMKNGKNTELPSFWIPTMTPAAGASKVEKPVSVYRCWLQTP